MKIGIHHRPGSFSDTWIKYCQEHGIPYQLVDAYRYDIIISCLNQAQAVY